VNKELIKKRFTKSLDTYELQADVQLHIAQKLAGKAARYLPTRCESLLEIGCGTGFLTREVLSRISANRIYLNDLVDMSTRKQQLAGESGINSNITFITGDVENIVFPEQLDAVLSASTLQWLVDLPAFYAKVNRALLSSGIFIFNTFGPNNLLEIKELMGEGLHYPLAADLSEMLEPSFEILEMTEETIIRSFNSPRDVLRHLQETGVTATHGDFRWTRNKLVTFENAYLEQFSKGTKVTLTWQVYYFVCKKKLVNNLHL
jgi:malonyl-CoA O-methyltransferase